ncbi:MAG: ABC transporter substrate-binding protein [Actinobacteria bacterium]|nr:ABC transporter substrate-binding protein [Actinomycetota bacterium]
MSDRPRPTSSRSPRRRHRLELLVAVVAAGGLLVSACGSPPSSGGGSGGREDAASDNKVDPKDCPLDALEKATGKVKVNVWYGGLVDPPKTVFTDMVKAFNASQDKIEVTADYQGNAYAEVLRKYEGASATPAQLPQIIYLEDTALGEMVDKGQVLPAQACMEADDYDPTQIIPSARAAYSVDGVLYPGYMNVSTPVLYYNKVHFQKAGLDPNDPPQTLDEIEEAAKKIKAAGVASKPLSFLANQWFFSTWMAGIGQDVVNNNNGRDKVPTEATFDTPETEAILGKLDSMNKAGLLNPFPVTDGSIDHYLALVTEQSSMLVETSTASGTIAQALGGDITAAEAGIDFDVAAIDTTKLVPASGQFPGVKAPGKVYASGGAFYILNTSDPAQQAASWKFLQFMLQPENVKTWHLVGGYLPMVKEVVDDPEVRKFQEEDLVGLLLKPAVDQLAAADPDQAGPLIGPYTKFQDEIQGAMESVLFSGADPKQALGKAQDNVNAILKDYNGG